MTTELGSYNRRKACRLCGQEELIEFLDLGNIPLAGGFLTKEEIPFEKVYPLDLCFCQNCSLVQVPNAVSSDSVFRKYFYYSSAIESLVDHFAAYANELTRSYLPPGKSFAVEIGCNDGVLLKPLQDSGVKCVGVDPATNVVDYARSRGLNVIDDYFDEKVASEIRNTYGSADAILSSNSFAHIDDMVEVMKGVQTLLKKSGVLLIEVHYLGSLIEELQYDVFYHEHLNYYSMMALSRFFESFGMEIFDIKKTTIHGGSIRYYVRNIGEREEPISNAVRELKEYEQSRRLDSLSTYVKFAEDVQEARQNLVTTLEELKKRNKRIVGYGASGRATTLMSYCGIDSRFLDYVIDDAPAKQGHYTPGTHLLIRPWDEKESSRIDYVLIFAWIWLEEIKKRRANYLRDGGRFIVPLPKVKIV